jgi:hypothetical protein
MKTEKIEIKLSTTAPRPLVENLDKVQVWQGIPPYGKTALAAFLDVASALLGKTYSQRYLAEVCGVSEMSIKFACQGRQCGKKVAAAISEKTLIPEHYLSGKETRLEWSFIMPPFLLELAKDKISQAKEKGAGNGRA